jgi:purine-binding chemotaxis protein CheW
MSDKSPLEKKREILRKRAEKLAIPVMEKALDRQFLEVVAFRLADEKYALESGFVREVVPLKGMSPIPGIPKHIKGIINVRGRIFSVVDLRVFFDLPGSEDAGPGKVILLDDGNMEMGIVADAIMGVRAVPLDQLRQGLPTLTGIREAYLRGLSGQDLVIIDAGKLLADKSLVVSDQ